MTGTTGKWGWRNDGDEAMADKMMGMTKQWGRGGGGDGKTIMRPPHHRVSTERFPHSHGHFSFLVLFVSSTKEYIYLLCNPHCSSTTCK